MAQPRLSDRRDSARLTGSYPARMWDHRRRMIGRGRTANFSEQGVFVLLRGARRLSADMTVVVELELPHSPADARLGRKVLYRARVARVEQMGQWRGIGLELQEKIQ